MKSFPTNGLANKINFFLCQSFMQTLITRYLQSVKKILSLPVRRVLRFLECKFGGINVCRKSLFKQVQRKNTTHFV